MKKKDQKSGGKMAAKKEKGFRRLKRGHFGAVVVTVVLIMTAVGICAALFAEFFLHYVVDARVLNEYHAIEFMGSLYEREEGERAYQMLDGEGRSYLITDAGGQEIHSSGEITVSDVGGEYLPTSSDERIVIYMDEELPLVFASEGHMTIRLGDTIRWINETGGMFGLQRGEGKMELPFWICVSVRGGQQKLLGHAAFQLDMTDVALIASIAGAFVLMVVIALILLICSFFSGIVRQHRIAALFFMDEVTGGHNWMWFLTRGEQLLRKRRNAAKHFAVLDVVLVKYRNFCVCHSIAEGEKLLRTVDDVIARSIGKKEISAHYASANFAVLLSYYEEAQLKQRITELIGKLEKISDVHQFGFHVGIDSIAIETGKNGRPVRRKQVDLEVEYNNACAARATLDGRDDSGIAFFDEKLVEEQRWINIVTEKQQKALDNEEFEVYYQPKYDPQTDKLRGAEALIRWNSPEYGFKGPGTFIPIFEKNGFITEIDHYMVRHVARDQKAWLDAGLPCVPVSVNISRAHFIESDLAEQIRDMIDEAGTPHDLIEIELTESAFFDDKAALIRTITKLKNFGFAVSMDDFGSGYSSLNSLKDMPLDVLKLDAEFFRGDTKDDRAQIVVSEAIRLAKSLHMRTVAEGVEIREQAEFLAENGCDMIQGYIYAKPMKREDFEQAVKKGVGSKEHGEDGP